MDIIDTIREYLDDPIINLIVATILGVTTTILIDKARERVKRLWWGMKIFPHESNYFGRNTIRDLAICRFVFWSSGKEVLSNGDISNVKPLLITFDYGCVIYRIKNLICSNPTISLDIIDQSKIAIKFDSLEPGEGAVFDILYAGNEAQPNLDGILKGGKISIKKMNPTDLSTIDQLLFGRLKPAQQIIALRWFYTFGFIILFIFLFMLLTWLPTILSSESSDLDSKLLAIFMTIRVILVLIIGAGIGIELWRLVVVPFKLRGYYDNINKTRHT